MNLKDCHYFNDFRKLAKKKLPSPIFHYIDGGADDESTLRRNTESFNDCDLVPNILASVGKPDLSTTVFGKKIDMPIFLSPITGFLITADSAGYIYTGVQAQYKLGILNITPSFTPGLYHEGDGKDLGHMLEFKSEVQLSFDLSKNTELGFSYNHLSNASLGDKNPGANSYMFNFFKNF